MNKKRKKKTRRKLKGELIVEKEQIEKFERSCGRPFDISRCPEMMSLVPNVDQLAAWQTTK